MNPQRKETMNTEERLANLEAEHMLDILKITALEARLDKALDIIAQACRLSAEMDEDVMKNREAINRHHTVLSKLINAGERMDSDLAGLIERERF